jgi:hypothetical protein
MKAPDGKTGSIRVSTIEQIIQRLGYEDEKVLYDTGPHFRKRLQGYASVRS